MRDVQVMRLWIDSEIVPSPFAAHCPLGLNAEWLLRLRIMRRQNYGCSSNKEYLAELFTYAFANHENLQILLGGELAAGHSTITGKP
jgi:hypothetical protein